MFPAVLAQSILLAQLIGMPLLKPAIAPPPESQQTTQTAQPPAPGAAQQTPAAQKAAPDNLADAFDHWTIGQLFKGKKKLTPEELGHVEFWVGLVKEPLLAAIGFIPRIFVAGIFVLLFWGINRGLRKLMNASFGKSNVDPSIRDMLGHLIKWGVMGFGLVIAFNQIGIQITALLTGVSIVGLAIGLAAQETLANFIAGIVIFWDKPFRVGDNIGLDEVAGAVQRVTFRSTRMLTADGEMVVFPNTYVLARKLINHSAHPLGRVSVPVSIAPTDSIDRAREVLIALPVADSRVCDDPAPAVVVSECADGRVKLVLRFWVRDKSCGGAALAEYVENAKKALDAAGIRGGAPAVHMMLDPARDPQQRDIRAAA
jgi:small conductance mechanosensitive channel